MQEILHATHHLKPLNKMYKYEIDPTRNEALQTQDAGWIDTQTEWDQYIP